VEKWQSDMGQTYYWQKDRIVQLWGSIAIANTSQKQKIKDPDSKSTLVLEAAWRRDIWGVKTLLDIGLNPNSTSRKLKALDCVAWTRNVKPVDCDGSGIKLKSEDAEIFDLLQSCVAVRGLEYMTEYQLSVGIPARFSFQLCG